MEQFLRGVFIRRWSQRALPMVAFKCSPEQQEKINYSVCFNPEATEMSIQKQDTVGSPTQIGNGLFWSLGRDEALKIDFLHCFQGVRFFSTFLGKISEWILSPPQGMTKMFWLPLILVFHKNAKGSEIILSLFKFHKIGRILSSTFQYLTTVVFTNIEGRLSSFTCNTVKGHRGVSCDIVSGSEISWLLLTVDLFYISIRLAKLAIVSDYSKHTMKFPMVQQQIVSCLKGFRVC